jgi:hypothetical protein
MMITQADHMKKSKDCAEGMYMHVFGLIFRSDEGTWIRPRVLLEGYVKKPHRNDTSASPKQYTYIIPFELIG